VLLRKLVIERALRSSIRELKAQPCKDVGLGASGTFYPYSGPQVPLQPFCDTPPQAQDFEGVTGCNFYLFKNKQALSLNLAISEEIGQRNLSKLT
jgi:hypothetical protein